jgi:hypothetical protein
VFVERVSHRANRGFSHKRTAGGQGVVICSV